MPTYSEILNMSVGIWNAKSGVDGTLNTASLVNTSDISNMDEVRVKTISVLGGATDGTLTIDNRPAITVPAGQIINLTPNGTLVNPVLVFTDTRHYLIEYVSNNFHGYSTGNV